jgi:hypothetical protein
MTQSIKKNLEKGSSVNKKQKSDLYDLPNIGVKSVLKLSEIGVFTIKDFIKLGPEKTYDKLCNFNKKHLHPAFLYVLRGAYFYVTSDIDYSLSTRWWEFRSPQDKEKMLYYKKKFNSKN